MRSPQVAVLTAVGLCALGVPPCAQGDFWERKPPLLTPRRLLAAAVEGGKIYTFGGCGSPCFQPPLHTSTFEETRLEVYDPATDRWSVKRPIPAILFGAAAAAPGKGKIYLFGGFVTRDSTYEYTPKTDTWVRKAPMPTPRHGLAAVAVDGKVYVLGGSTGSAPSRALEIYDPATNTWEARAPPMPTARVFLAAAVVGKKIYAIGGSPDCCGESRTAAVEVYDVDGNSWSTAESLPVALQVSAAATAPNGKIYVFGGFIPGSGVQDTTFEYDPATDDWDTKTRLLPPRSGGEPGRDQAPAVALGDGIHLLGGSTDCHCRALDDHDRYVPGVPPKEPADLRITKDNGLTQLCPRQSVVYTIVVRNNGPDPVEGAAVTDALPTLFTGPTWTCTPSAGATRTRPCPLPGQPLDDRVNLPVGGRVTYTLSGTVAAASGRLTNCARVKVPDGVTDEVPGNDLDCDSDPVVSCCLAPTIEKTDGREVVGPGDEPVYEITVGNPSPAPLLVTVKDDLEASGLTGVRWCQGPGCTPSSEGNLKDTEDLPASGTVVYRATGTVPAPSPCACEPPKPIDNTATVTVVGKPDCGDSDTDVDSITPPPPGDLDMTITTPPGVEGCALQRTITVTNSGPGTACGVVLSAGASGDFELESLSVPCAGGPLCARGDIAPATPPVVITASLAPAPDASCPAVGALTASVASSCPPPGDSASASLDIEVPCDLCIVKSVDKDTADPGDPLLYTIEVTNPGCVAVSSATVSDTFPSELEGVMWCRGAGCTPDEPPDLSDTLALAPGGSETYVASGTVPLLFVDTICNTAVVEFAGDDADPTDNNDSTVCTSPSPPDGPFVIPTASDYALAALALLLAALALVRLRLAAP